MTVFRTRCGWPARKLGTLEGRKDQHVWAIAHPTNGEFVMVLDRHGNAPVDHNKYSVALPDEIEEMFAP